MKKLGKYIIQGELGQGGMGMVYRARDPDIGRDVAIKMIHERALNVPEVRERFYREARSAGRLSHENITVIHDIGEQDGEPFIVMELLSGADLRTTLLTTQMAMPLDQKLDIALQVCRGLLYAHQHHIIHRDIKPENIRVLTSGRIKIMDFGIARIGGDSQTLTHSSIGSPRYMSPEQVRGKTIDHRTDIFSFGVLLYELVTGVNPFSGDHVTTVIYKIIHEEPEPINLDNPHLTEGLQQIISRCLEKDVHKRYQSFAEVIEDLSDLLTRLRMERPVGGTLSAERTLTHALRPSTRPSSKPSQKRSTPWVRAAAGVVLLGGLVAGGYFLWPVVQPTPPPMNETATVPSEAGTAAPPVEPPAATPDPSAPATDSAASTDPPSAEPPASEEASPPADDDLQQLRAEVDRRRARMQAQRQQATAADAPTLASALYAQAQRLEQAGHDALAQETPDGYASAERAFADAAQRYAAAAEAAGQRQEADQAQHAMEQARQQILDAREDDAIASAFEQADALRATALQRYESGQFALSTATFNAARERYAELRQQLDAAAGTASAASEAQLEAAMQARTAMRAAKDPIPPDQRQHPQYQQALQLEDQGQQAFAAEAFEAAAAHFTQAESTFQEVAEIARAEAQARQAIQDLVARFERTFEQEDLDALQAFHSFYAAWSSFFDVADNVNATASSENLDVRGDAASVQVHLQFDYRDNKNRSQSNSFVHTWSLQRTGDGTWTVTEVTPQ